MRKTRRICLCLVAVFIISTLAGCSVSLIGPNTQPTIIPGGQKTSVTPVPTAPNATSTPQPTNTPKPTATPTAEPSPTEAPVTPTEEATPTPEATSTPTPTATNTPTPTPIPYSAAACRNALIDKIGNSYTVSAGESLSVNGGKYYKFTVSDAEHTYTPDVIVDVYYRTVYYYFANTAEMVELETFPLDRGESGGVTIDPDKALTLQEAIAILSSIPKDKLGIQKDVNEHSILFEPDNLATRRGFPDVKFYVVTLINSKNQMAGEFWITSDKEDVYRVGDWDDFTLIK